MKKWLVIFALSLLAFGEVAAQKTETKSAEVVNIAGTDYFMHTVTQGETIYSLSRIYGITEERLYRDNPAVKDNGLRTGETIRILCVEIPEVKMSRRRMQRTFATHTVLPGETTYSIAKRYSLSLNTLIRDNPGLDPAHLGTGRELLIRKSEMDKTSPRQILSQISDFASTLTDISDEYAYHPVEMGETLYSIGREYNVPIAEIETANNLKEGLRAGMIIKVPSQGYQGREGQVIPGRVSDAAGTGHVDGSGNIGEQILTPPDKRPYLGTMNISMLLPLSGDNNVRTGFMEFYEGALIAASELRNAGNNVEFNLFDTGRSPETIIGITATDAFRNSDVVIGPVYEDELPAVMEFSAHTGVPVVSPLADLKGTYGSTLYRMSPQPERRYDKMKPLLEGNRNVIFITSDVNDNEFEKEMRSVAGNQPYQRVVYSKGTPSEQIDELLAGSGTDNVFVVLAGDESGVDLILAALSSVQNNRLARSRSTGTIIVAGNSKWARYRNLDRNLFFKLNVSFVTSYHADRGNEAVVDFDNRYIAAFGRIPTLYSYRGYDAVKMFGNAIAGGGAGFSEIKGSVAVPLQTPYSFTAGPGGETVNTGWALVSYGSDYKISVR